MSSFWLVILSYRYQHCRKQLCSYCSSLLTLVRRKIIREHLPSFSKGKHQTRLFVRESEATWFQVVHLYQTGAQVPLKSAYPEGKKNWHSVLSAGALCILPNLGAEVLYAYWQIWGQSLTDSVFWVPVNSCTFMSQVSLSSWLSPPFPFELGKEEVNAGYVLLRKSLSVEMGVYGWQCMDDCFSGLFWALRFIHTRCYGHHHMRFSDRFQCCHLDSK